MLSATCRPVRTGNKSASIALLPGAKHVFPVRCLSNPRAPRVRLQVKIGAACGALAGAGLALSILFDQDR